MIADIVSMIPQAGPQACDPSGASSIPGVCDKVNKVFTWVQVIGYAICGLGIVITGTMMAIGQRRGEGGEHAARLGWVMAGCILIGLATGFVTFLKS